MITLKEIVYDERANNGEWCTYPYEGHKNGCPNFPACMKNRADFKLFENKYNWYAVVEEFDLKFHADKMKAKHPEWSERQCRCLLYWQGGVRKRLKEKAETAFAGYNLILTIPEAHGINVFETMAKVGIIIDKHPDIVRKVMFIGKPK